MPVILSGSPFRLVREGINAFPLSPFVHEPQFGAVRKKPRSAPASKTRDQFDRKTPKPLSIGVVVSSGKLGKNSNTASLVRMARSRGHQVTLIDSRKVVLATIGPKAEIFMEGKPLPRFDMVLARLGSSYNGGSQRNLALMRHLEVMGIPLLNPSTGIESANDKFRTHQLLAKAGIDMPDTIMIYQQKPPRQQLEWLFSKGKSLIIKLLEGSQGKGVVLAPTPKSSESMVEALSVLKGRMLAQEFLADAHGRDIRCFVIDGKVVAAMERQAAKGEFRANLSLGGSGHRITLTEQEADIAIRAAKALKLTVSGIDLIRTAQGPKVIEVNSAPSLKGITQASGLNIAELVIKALEEKCLRIKARAKM